MVLAREISPESPMWETDKVAGKHESEEVFCF